MGFDFRTGRYRRYVNFGKRTVKDGEAAIVWKRNGRCKQVIGPKLQRLCFSTIKFLDRHMATKQQYIVVVRRTGEIEHMAGPCVVYENPVLHEAVAVKDAIQLKTPQDCVVVCTETPAPAPAKNTAAPPAGKPGGKPGHRAAGAAARDEDEAEDGPAAPVASTVVQNRRVIRGPCLYTPSVDETPLAFNWTDTSATLTGGHGAAPKGAPFVILPLTPQRFAVRVGAGTSDNHESKVDLEVVFQLARVEAAANCADPVATLWQALEVDVARIARQHTVEELHRLGVASFASLAAYSATQARAGEVGAQVVSVDCKGLQKTKAMLQRLNSAAASEAQHQGKLEANLRANLLADAEVAAKLERTQQHERLEQAKFQASVRQEEHAHALRRTKLANQLSLDGSAREAQITATREQNTVLVEFLGNLSTLGVDVTRLLTTGGNKGLAEATRETVARTLACGPAVATMSLSLGAAAAAAAAGAGAGTDLDAPLVFGERETTI